MDNTDSDSSSDLTPYSDQSDAEDAEEFNTDLPAEHNYLGNLERVSGVQYLEANKSYRLPIFFHDSLIFPGETLPMILAQQLFLATKFNDDGLLFGLVFLNVRSDDNLYLYGVTCQIYEKSNSGTSGDSVSIKSRAYQRMYIKKTELLHYRVIPEFLYSTTARYAIVTILPEIVLPDPIFGHDSNSLSKHRLNKSCKRRVLRYQTETTPWPLFVYDLYDTERVIEKIKAFLIKLKIETGSMDLVSLSFWFSQNAVLSAETRRNAFLTNSVLQRLKLIGNSIDEDKFIVCQKCNQKLTHYNKLFAMSKEGVQTSYCNSSGFIHETHTITEMLPDAVTVTGLPTNEFSWFPGYAWRFAHCSHCGGHLGWKYLAEKPNLLPRNFFGLTGKSIRLESDPDGDQFAVIISGSDSES